MRTQARAEPTFDFRQAEVLLIDKSEGSMELTTQMLFGFGFNKFDRYTNFEQDQDRRSDGRHDLVLIDPSADNETAMSFIQDLRRQDASGDGATLIIVVTATPNVDVIKAARQSGADYVLAKPFSAKILLDRILWVAAEKAAGGPLADEDPHSLH